MKPDLHFKPTARLPSPGFVNWFLAEYYPTYSTYEIKKREQPFQMAPIATGREVYSYTHGLYGRAVKKQLEQ